MKQMHSIFMQRMALVFGAIFCSSAQAVTTKPLSDLFIYPIYSFPAEVVAHTETSLSSELNARLQSVQVRPGESVESGQLLAQLDCGDTKDALALNASLQAESQAQLKLAQLQLQRFRNLEKQQYTATSQIDESQTQVQSILAHLSGLQVQQQQAERAVKRCQVRAPFAGVVTDLMAGKGQWLSVGAPVMKLVRSDLAEIEVQLPLTLANDMAQQTGSWQVKGRSEQAVEWLRQSQVLSPNQRMATVWFRAPESDPIGLAGTLVVTNQQGHLPAEYVVMRSGQLGVFIAESGKAVFKVLADAQAGRPAKIPADWSGSLSVVTEGQHRIQQGEALP